MDNYLFSLIGMSLIGTWALCVVTLICSHLNNIQTLKLEHCRISMDNKQWHECELINMKLREKLLWKMINDKLEPCEIRAAAAACGIELPDVEYQPCDDEDCDCNHNGGENEHGPAEVVPNNPSNPSNPNNPQTTEEANRRYGLELYGRES